MRQFCHFLQRVGTDPFAFQYAEHRKALPTDKTPCCRLSSMPLVRFIEDEWRKGLTFGTVNLNHDSHSVITAH
jgi:hypothetical protein